MNRSRPTRLRALKRAASLRCCRRPESALFPANPLAKVRTMTLNPSPQDAAASLEAFRSEVRAFIAEALPDELRARVERGYDHITREDHSFWQRQLFARGWAAPGWPVEHGGTGWTAVQRQAFDEECGRASCPRTQPQGVKMIGPIIYTFGTAAQKARFLEPILKADEWWCQGYSEPGAGSDLA